MLSDQQFGEMATRIQDPGTGYSINVKNGKPAAEGSYMVSQKGGNQHFGQGETVTGAHVQAHTLKHLAELQKPGRYAGGWHSDETGEKDLDVSQRFESHERAQHTMIANDEDALYVNGVNGRNNDERNWLGRGAPKGGSLKGHLPQGVSPMTPEGYSALRKLSRRAAR
jgi:hypothetical protein